MSVRSTSSDERGSRAGCTIWLTGLPSSGKSTIADAVASTLLAAGRSVEILDGDQVRTHLGDLPFDRAGRDRNVHRIGWLATLLARNGVVVLAAVISPYRSARELVRAWHASEAIPFVEVHVAAPASVCADRDVKGLYARQQAGLMTALTGVDDPYEVPLNPDILLRTDREDVRQSTAAVTSFLSKQGLI